MSSESDRPTWIGLDHRARQVGHRHDDPLVAPWGAEHDARLDLQLLRPVWAYCRSMNSIMPTRTGMMTATSSD